MCMKLLSNEKYRDNKQLNIQIFNKRKTTIKSDMEILGKLKNINLRRKNTK